MSENGASSLAVQSQQRYLELLLRAGEVLSSALDWRETVKAVCDSVVETVADLCFLYLTNEEGELKLAASASAHSDPAPRLKEAERFIHGPMRRTPLVHQVIERGEPLCVPQVTDEFFPLKYRSVIVVPVVTKTQGVVGALGVIRTDRTAELFSEDDLRFVYDLARRCGTAIGKAMLYEQTRRIATVYQRAALPAHLPQADGIAFDACYEPSSEELLVGGDWYDAFTLPDGRIAITIGDVLGHGLDAAVWMSRLRNGFRAALFADPDPAQALEIVDRMIRADVDGDFFTTALTALVDPVRQTLTCASAGHPGPLVWTGTGEVIDPFLARGLPLGMRQFEQPSRTAPMLNVHAGSFAVFFTDGLLEWNRDIASSWNALQAALEKQPIRESQHPAQALRDAVIRGARHTDDVAILTVRWDVERRASSI